MGHVGKHLRGLVRVASGVAALGVAAGIALAGSAAAPASTEASRVVTISFSDAGQGRWSTVGDYDTGSMAMNYNWRGTAKFRVPVAALQNPSKAKFSVRGTGTIVASWVGDYVGKQTGTPQAGPYHCSYKGTNVKAGVDAQFANGLKKGTLRISLFARSTAKGVYFLPSSGGGATQQCATSVGADGPAHFAPGALFRDSYNIGGQLTTQTAFIDVPAKLLPRSSLKIVFPRETGSVDSPDRPALKWHNTGTLTVKAR
jgi:hypothetical protein